MTADTNTDNRSVVLQLKRQKMINQCIVLLMAPKTKMFYSITFHYFKLHYLTSHIPLFTVLVMCVAVHFCRCNAGNFPTVGLITECFGVPYLQSLYFLTLT